MHYLIRMLVKQKLLKATASLLVVSLCPVQHGSSLAFRCLSYHW